MSFLAKLALHKVFFTRTFNYQLNIQHSRWESLQMGPFLSGVFKRSNEWASTEKVYHLIYGPYGIDPASMLMPQVGFKATV